MTYKQFILTLLSDHYDCLGYSEQEIKVIINETPFPHIERYLNKQGYNTKQLYKECLNQL